MFDLRLIINSKPRYQCLSRKSNILKLRFFVVHFDNILMKVLILFFRAYFTHISVIFVRKTQMRLTKIYISKYLILKWHYCNFYRYSK